MLKKIFSVMCMAAVIVFAAHSQAFAAKVAIVLDAPTGTFTEPEKVYSMVETSLGKILQNSSDYEIISPADTENYVQIYREEHDMIMSTGADEGQHEEKWLKKEDINNICNYFGGNYVIYIRVTSTAPKHSMGVFTSGQKMNVVTDFRVWSNAKKDFSYMKRATTQGSSQTVNVSIFGRGSGSSSHALEKGLNKGLQEIEKDSAKIREAMMQG
ncbi:MAG: hypothetical protein IJQ85_00225 [Selenomonadaceae bacterium]|nr:hypothetical protein [Selenomonadaceae bacterium]